MILKHVSRLFCLSAVICFFVLGCKKTVPIDEAVADNTSNGVAYGDALSTASIGEPINLIPAISADSASAEVASYIYNGLVKYDKDLKLVGDLAESWIITDDNLQIIFFLRKDVLWHDGTPFTAKDVEFTYQFMIDNNTPTSYDADFRKVKSFEIIDDYAVKIKYSEPYAPALNSWGIWIMPYHLLNGISPTKSTLQRTPIGTGPYKIDEWVSGTKVTLKSFHDYFEGRPKVEQIVMRIIPDSATQFLELLNGSIDIMQLSAMQAAKQTDKERYVVQYNTYTYLDDSYTYVGYNLKKEPFNDIRVRKALSYAIPKDDIINGILFGKAVATGGPYKNGTLWYNDNVTKYDYNPKRAADLLMAAGYTDSDNDGYLDKNGKRLKFEIITNQGNVTRSQIAEVLQRSYKNLGIDVEVRILEWATYINEYINKGNFSVIVMGWNIIQDPDLYDVWHSSKCGGHGLNFICYKNAEVDRLLVEGQKVYDRSKRKVFYDKIQEILADEVPYTFLYTPYANVALNKRFKNIKPAPAGLKHNLIDWYVDKANQRYNFEK